MNRLWNVIAMIFVLLCEVIGFSSCTNEDEKEFTSDLTQYKWVCRSDQFSTSSTIEYDAYVYTFYFVSSTEGILHTYFKWMDSDGDGDNRTDNYFFTYTVNGNRINVKYDDGTTSQLTINSNGSLKDGSGWIYTKESLTSSDRTFIAKETLNHQYNGDLDFDYEIGFNDFMNIAPQRNSDGTYSHLIYMVYGIPAEMQRRGVREFGIAVDVENGTVENATNKITDDAYVKKRYVNGKNVTTFTTTVPDNNKHTWGVLLSIKSKSKDVLLKYTVILNIGDMEIGDEYSSYFKRCDYDNKYVYRVGWVEERYSFGGNSGNDNDEDDDNNKTESGSNDDDKGSNDVPNNEKKYLNGHEYIDLGLSVKWATCNVGAEKPEEFGGYYAWGEIEEKSEYNWSTYLADIGGKISNYWYCGSYSDPLREYVSNYKSIAGTQYDVAHVKWGSSWRMPTKEQLEELFDNCTLEQTKLNGVNVYKMQSNKNHNSIFLPAASYKTESGLWNDSFYGGYLSATPCYDDEARASSITITYKEKVKRTVYWRYLGYSIRPVCP